MLSELHNILLLKTTMSADDYARLTHLKTGPQPEVDLAAIFGDEEDEYTTVLDLKEDMELLNITALTP